MSDSWVCPGGLPGVRDKQLSFCTYSRVKMLYMSVRVSLSMGLSDGQVICMPIWIVHYQIQKVGEPRTLRRKWSHQCHENFGGTNEVPTEPAESGTRLERLTPEDRPYS